uniref:Uncharacterized protein n=1 Tax=Solanum lycopersicum TaxID=4081 RepID=A0A3Q7H0G8_SOLLC
MLILKHADLWHMLSVLRSIITHYLLCLGVLHICIKRCLCGNKHVIFWLSLTLYYVFPIITV